MDINLGWTYLKHDIDQWTWRLGDMRKEDPGKRFSSQSDDNEADETFIRRKIEEAVVTLKVSLSGLLEDMPGDSDDSLDTDTGNWVLRMKDRRGGYDGESLATLAHKYVVWFVLWNWCLIYFEELAGKFEEELKGIASNIEEAAYSRKAPRKCKRKPFKDIDDVIIDDVIIETGE